MDCRKLSYRIILFIILVFVSLTTLFSCKKKEEAPAPASGQFDLRKSRTKNEVPASAPAETAQDDSQRKVIMSHALSLEVKSLSAALWGAIGSGLDNLNIANRMKI